MKTLGDLVLDRRVHAALVVAVGVLAYANTFGAPFTFDDQRCIVANPVLRSLDYFADPARANAIPGVQTCTFQLRSFGLLTLALNYRIGGLEPAGYHLVNVAVHVAAALLVYLLVALALRTPFFEGRPREEAQGLVPLFAALLFVAHPLQTQAVTYVTQRFASLATLLYLLTVVLYLAARLSSRPAPKVAGFACAAVAALLALRTKEIAFTLPFALTLIELALLRGAWWRRAAFLAPFFAIALSLPARLGLLASATSISEADASMQAAGGSQLSRWEYVVTQLRVVATYLRLFVLPAGQNVDPDFPAYRSLLAPPVLLSLALLLALLVAAVVLYRRSARPDAGVPVLRLAAVGILWLFGTLAVESGAIPLSDLLVEHRMYLPMAGLCVAAAALAVALRERLRATRPGAAAAVLPALSAAVALLAIATFARNEVWGDEVRLWEDAAAKSPAKLRPRMELAALYSARGRPEDALRQIGAVLELQPGYAPAYNSLGVILRREGRLDQATEGYRAALRLDPGFAEARHNLALALLAQGRLDEATRELEAATRSKPDYAEAHNALGVLYAQQGRMADAVAEWQATLRVNPAHAKARANLERAMRGF